MADKKLPRGRDLPGKKSPRTSGKAPGKRPGQKKSPYTALISAHTADPSAPLPELLAPAGSMESLRAALAGGADAVYFGGAAFSNRMRAKNFTDENLIDALSLVHRCGAKAYITVNTRVRDREMEDMMALCRVILSGDNPAGEICDAVICADLGAAARIRAAYPDAVLHASTQTSLSSPADCDAIRELGFTRLVVPRELSLTEIRHIADNTDMELEMFIHGAHCVSLSGQCLMSFIMGGRSGNRGECAQPCRLPYRIDGGPESTPISLADMCLAGRITEVIDSGAVSLKIEGRLKSAPYVYGVTRIYRRLLDERRNASPDELAELESLFTRRFTDGFATRHYGTMSGGTGSETNTSAFESEIRTALNERIARADQAKHDDRLPVTAEFFLRSGEPAALTLTLPQFGDTFATAVGSVPQTASGAPLTPESAAKNLTKLGGTPFILSPSDITFRMEDNLWLPVSELNRLRRDAVLALTEKTEILDEKTAVEYAAPVYSPNLTPRSHKSAVQTAELADASVLAAASADEIRAVFAHFARVFVPAGDIPPLLDDFVKRNLTAEAEKLCAVLPVITPSDGQIHRALDSLASMPSKRVLCHTAGQGALAKSRGFTADMSFRANVWNRDAMAYYAPRFDVTYLSPELPEGAQCDLGQYGGGIIIYGRLPLMTTGRCAICGGKCEKGNIGGRWENARPHTCRADLTDRKNETFPMLGQADCSTVIYNAHPIWMADRMTPALKQKPAALHFMFTVESVREMLDAAEGYEAGRAGNGRRLGK